MYKGNIFFWLCLSFVFGIGVASFWTMPAWWVLTLMIPGIILVAVFWGKSRLTIIGVCLLIGMGGVYYYEATGDIVFNNVSNFNDSEEVEIIGRVAAAPEERSSNTKIELTAETVNSEPVEGSVLVSVPRYPKYEYGDKLRVHGKLQTPAEFEGFSYKDYLARYGIHSVMYLADIERLESGGGSRVWATVLALKSKLKHGLVVSLPEPESGFAQRLLLGERKAMSAEVLEAFKKTGTMHIVAISGYHVTIVATLLMLITQPLGRRWSFVVAVSAILFYALITGASASVIRAAIMGILVLVAMQVGRLPSLRNTIVLAAVVMLALNPLLLRYDIGFQLSFLAVLGIAYVSPWLEKAFKGLPNILAFRDSVIITLSAMVTTLPLSVYHFGRLAVISPLVNFVLLPSIPLSMGLSFITSVSGSIHEFLGRIVALPTWLSLRYGIAVVSWGAKIPGAYFDMEKLGWGWLPVMYGAMGLGLFLIHKTQNSNPKLKVQSKSNVQIQ